MVVTQRIHDEDTEKKKIGITVEMKNFGPIADGRIKIKPLTLLIGPNNSGKSYAATLIYSLFRAFYYSLPIHRRLYFELDSRDFLDILSMKEISELEEKGKIEIPLERFFHKFLQRIYEETLSNEIIRSYACPLKDLIRIGEKSFLLRIDKDSYDINLECNDNMLKIKEYPQLSKKAIVRISKRVGGFYRLVKEGDKISHAIDLEIEDSPEILLDILTDRISTYFLSDIPEGTLTPCYYLPAARSGILQGHRALAANVVRNAPLAGIERMEVPEFSGVVADFISTLIELPEKRGPLYGLAQECERELIGGAVIMKKPEKYRYPEIQYEYQKMKIPLHRASSTVSELGPLFLYLKYIIEPGSILIIEEPEAHLHPENQRILAKYMVKLIKKGVYVMITTHSDYLIDQLSNFILLGKVPTEKRSAYEYSAEESLNVDEIAAYVFTYDEKVGGNRISEVEITEEDGISQEEHMRIVNALYDETVRLQRDLGG